MSCRGSEAKEMSPRHVISDYCSKISRVKVSRCPAGAARQRKCCGPRTFVHDDVYNHGCNQAPRGSVLCSATLDGMCVWETLGTLYLLRSAHIFKQVSRRMAVATCFAQPRLMECVCGVTGSIKFGPPYLRPKHGRGSVLCSASLDEICVWVKRGRLY